MGSLWSQDESSLGVKVERPGTGIHGAPPIDLQVAAYEKHVWLVASNWSPFEGEFDRRSEFPPRFHGPENGWSFDQES